MTSHWDTEHRLAKRRQRLRRERDEAIYQRNRAVRQLAKVTDGWTYTPEYSLLNEPWAREVLQGD